jgi:hypothetical protein
MPRFKTPDYGLKLIPVDFTQQGKRPSTTVFLSLIQRAIIAHIRAPQCCVHKGDHGHKSPNGTWVWPFPVSPDRLINLTWGGLELHGAEIAQG